MKKFLLLVFALFLLSVSNAQFLLVEKYEPKDILENGQTNAVKIPFSKFKLDNGLTVIISEDHNKPLVNINVTYKVGSSNDYADRTGMAYMIYTLMENGSKHLGKGEYNKIINHYGGKMYSTITRDKTTFAATVPKNLLPTVLWMESDRQAYFLDSLTKDKFDKAKLDIIAKMYDSLYHQPYGLTDILAMKNLYPYAHPYTWPVFGMMDHYQIYQLPDLKKYFLDWYGTNNTIITITGDVNSVEVISLVNKYFGSLTKSPQTTAFVDDIINRIMLGAGTEFTEPRYISYKLEIPNPLLKVVFNTVPRFSPDEKALNVIASLLGQGKNSILYNEFVKKGYAIYVNAQHKTYKYYGEFTIDIMANPDTSLAVIAKKLDKLLNDIVVSRNIYASSAISQTPVPAPTIMPSPINPPPPQPNMPSQHKIPSKPNNAPQPNIPPPPQPNMPQQEINPPQVSVLPSPEQLMINETRSADAIFRTVSEKKSEELWTLESLQNKGSMLSDRELMNGKPSEISPSLIEYNQINPQTFFTLFNRYILTSAKLYVSYISKDKEKLIAAPDNIKEMELQSILTPTKDQDLVYRYPAKEINKKQPKIKDIPVNSKFEFKPETTQSGMTISYVQSKDFPLVTINLRLKATKLKKLLPTVDVTGMIAWLYNDWFETQGNDNPLKAVTLSGSLVQFKQENDFVTISIICSKENVMLAKEALLQMLFRQDYGIEPITPQFTNLFDNPLNAGNFKKANNDDIIEYLSSNPFDTLYQKDTLTKAAIAKKRVLVAFSKLFTPKYISASVYGDIEEGQYRDLYMNLSQWQSISGNSGGIMETPLNSPDSINVNQLKTPSQGNIYFLPDKNKEIAKIIVEYMQLPVEVSADYYTGGLANYIFGMSSENYLNNNLKGYDYILGIKTRHYYRNNKECYAVVLNVKADKFVDAYNKLMNVLENFKTYNPDKKYFNALKTEYLYKDATNFETFTQKEQYCNYLINNKISSEVINNNYDYSKKLKASKISKFWASSYNTQNQRVIVIGNESQIPGGIINTGNKMVLINRSGTVINQ